jgi:diketogulonate reductase-like aldo/keto reductase
MQIPTKKLSNGFELPLVGLGTWLMGGKTTKDPNNDDSKDIKAIQNAINLGITHIDTAERYADGYAEVLIGKAIKKFERNKLFITSKVAPTNLKYDDVIKAAKASLKRLQTEYLDLYLIHQPNPKIPLKETMTALDLLKEQGLIKNIGVSNFNIQEFETAQSYTKYKIVNNQLHLNLKYRESERKGLVKYCQDNDILFTAWRPLQKGILLKENNNLLDEMCQKYKKTPAQIAINWLISQKNIVTIIKSTNPEHLKENIDAASWTMDEQDIQKLDKEFPDQQDISDAVPLN